MPLPHNTQSIPNKKKANKILKAKRIYILGMRSSFTIAQYLGFYLGIILDSVHIIRMDMGDAFEQVIKINEEKMREANAALYAAFDEATKEK
mgnify:CR=1 FL=1